MMEVSERTPEITFRSSIESKSVGTACSQLLLELKKLSEPLKKKYRLELTPQGSDHWDLRLKLDSVAWFDNLLLEKGIQKALEFARQFVDKTREELRAKPILDPSSEVPETIPNYCIQFGCPHKICRNGKHPHNRCVTEMRRADGARRPCGFFLFQELIVGDDELNRILKKPNYQLSSRREPVRSLLLTPSSHFTNASLVEDQAFWDLVFELNTHLKKLLIFEGQSEEPLEMIALNFGQWETAQSIDQNQYNLDCHGHAHLLLNRKIFDILEKKKSFSGLKGRYQDPNTHLEQDCKELEQARLLGLENRLLREDVHTLKTDVNTLKTDVNTLNNKVDRILSILTKDTNN